MAEYIVEVNENTGIEFPSEIIEKMAISPGDKMIIRFDHAEEHLVIGKIPMDAPEKFQEIKDTIGKTIKIK